MSELTVQYIQARS